MYISAGKVTLVGEIILKMQRGEIIMSICQKKKKRKRIVKYSVQFILIRRSNRSLTTFPKIEII